MAVKAAVVLSVLLHEAFLMVVVAALEREG